MGDVVVATLDPTGAIAVTGSNDGQARVWGPEEWNDARALGASTTMSSRSPLRTTECTSSRAAPTARRGRGRQRRASCALHAGHTDAVTGVLFTPDGHALVTGSADGTVRAWDAGTAPDLVSASVVPPTPPSLQARSPDGSVVARADGAVVRLVHQRRIDCHPRGPRRRRHQRRLLAGRAQTGDGLPRQRRDAVGRPRRGARPACSEPTSARSSTRGSARTDDGS